MPEPSRYRLPRTVVPSRYALVLEPNLDAATFAGTVDIDVEVNETTSQVVLNALELEIQHARLEIEGRRIAATPSFDTEAQRCTLELREPAQAGPARLHLEFTGVLNDKLVGFYRSTFKDGNGVEHVIATTQFEAPHARRAFPCWDEPDLKATFAVTLVVPEGLSALSNGKETSSEPAGDGRTRVVFAETMKMSTYLVAFVVGPFELTDPIDIEGVPLRVAHVPGKAHLAEYALECGEFALRFFGRYYGIPYPSDKLDLVAIPDFAFGAMENLGCVTFREAALLLDRKLAPQPDLLRVADVIHHEIAHMWFGDLVTMRWWNGIWLNEAFATFMEMKCTDAFRPEWLRWVDFGLSRTAAFDVDSLESTRAVEYEVASPEDAEGMFDILTYEKGASVLLMLEQFIGEDEFMDGVRRYLNDNAYGNTETTDLWDSIEAATSQPVRRIMDSWIFQGGYPILTAAVTGSTLHLTQRRFRYWGDDFGEQWLVPVLLRYGTGTSLGATKLLLDDRQKDFPLDFSPDWVVVNAAATGFYRVGYSADLLKGLTTLGLKSLSALERYAVLDDAFASMLAGTTRAAEYLSLARSYSDETDLAVWQRLVGTIGTLNRIVDERVKPQFRLEVQRLVAPALGRLGTEPSGEEDERTAQLRATLFEAMGTFGKSEATIALARSIHITFLDDPEGVAPGLAAASIQVIAENGEETDFELFWKRHLETTNPQLKNRYLHALGRFSDSELIARLLDLAMTEVRTQDAPFVFNRALTNETRGPQVWKFIAENWERINERFTPNLVVRMVEGVRTFTDPNLAGEVESFFKAHPVKQGEKTLAQHLEKMRVIVNLKRREGAAFSASLG